MTPTPAWLTDQEVCKLLGISERTLREMLAGGPVNCPSPFVHIGKGAKFPRRRWRPELIWAWLEAADAKARPAPPEPKAVTKSANRADVAPIEPPSPDRVRQRTS